LDVYDLWKTPFSWQQCQSRQQSNKASLDAQLAAGQSENRRRPEAYSRVYKLHPFWADSEGRVTVMSSE